MIKKYKHSIADLLKEDSNYIVYVDCKKKGNKELMSYMLQCFIDTFVKKDEQEAVIKDIMVRPSPLHNDGRTQWKDWVEKYKGDNFLNDLFTEHAIQFTEFCAQKEIEKPGLGETYKLRSQGFMFFKMAELMEEYGKRHNCLYIDHPENTNEFEQKGINAFIQRRGQIGMTIDKFFDIKINNASEAWHPYPTHS